MDNINKFDLHLTQLILKTKNLKNDKREVLVGNLDKNFIYINNNPLDLVIKNGKSLNFCKIELNQYFNVEYVHRLKNTPFFVSLLSCKFFQIKIIDFYEWRKKTEIYRLFILKNISSGDLQNTANIKLDFGLKPKNISEKCLQLDDLMLEISEEFKLSNNCVSIEIPGSNYVNCFYSLFRFNKDKTLCNDTNAIIKLFYELENLCRSNHISKYFITKNQSADSELDELWNTQKFILPDLNITKNMTSNTNSYETEKIWIDDFYKYFSFTEKITYDLNNIKLKTIDIIDFLPTKRLLLEYHKKNILLDNKIRKEVQTWWDVFSFRLFGQIFTDKCINEPSEVFAVYFLAVKLNLPWAPILLQKIKDCLKDKHHTFLHNFLFFLAHLYIRLIKAKSENNSETIYSPGYFWDNNYKSINNEIEITKFSKEAYTKLFINDSHIFKINKLCRIIYNKQQNYIKLFTVDDYSPHTNYLFLKIDNFTIELPLVWHNGYFEFLNLRFKWIIKKSRFQITIHSDQTRLIDIDNSQVEIAKDKKLIYYIPVERNNPQIFISLFNSQGGELFSKIHSCKQEIILKGSVINQYGIISNKILYSTSKRYHSLFGYKEVYNNTSEILLNRDTTQLKFKAKQLNYSLTIPFIENDFISYMLDLDSNFKNKLLLMIDPKFKVDMSNILHYFENNFGFQPEFFLNNKNQVKEYRASLIIEFKYSNESFYEFTEKNKVTFKGNRVVVIIQYLKQIFAQNLKIIEKQEDLVS